MGIEIERKFLVATDAWEQETVESRGIVQGYLSEDVSSCVRVRIAGDSAFLTVKGMGDGVSRPEFEYSVPVADAEQMMEMCGSRVLAKRRHLVPADGGLQWEVDVFSGRHEGLALAEIELPDPEFEFSRPAWLGKEVTGEIAYLNQTLALSKKDSMPAKPITALRI